MPYAGLTLHDFRLATHCNCPKDAEVIIISEWCVTLCDFVTILNIEGNFQKFMRDWGQSQEKSQSQEINRVG